MTCFDFTDPKDMVIDDTHMSTMDVFVTEHHECAQLLGPDGKPLAYEEPQRAGFAIWSD